MENTRTSNSIKNAKTGMLVQIINKLMIFLVRTIFINVLNAEYLGVNGLFLNILSILSFAELGIGTAIIFNMYKPVAENNKEKLKSLMLLYRKCYTLIGIVVLVLGLCLVPFLEILVRDVPNIKENIKFIYLLFLINTSISYFFTYKKSIISAYQQERIINRIDTIIYFGKSIAEILILLVTRNYILYLLIEIIATILGNILVSNKANKMFPYLKDKEVKELNKQEKKDIFKNVKSLVIYKFGGIILNSTDNILLSALVNVVTVGYCSNYTMLINAIKSIVTSGLNGITASIGNLNAIGEKDTKEKVFYELTFINFWIYTFCSIAFIVLLSPFIKIWLGSEYVMGIGIPITLAISFFVDGMRNTAYTYRVTLGLFEKGRITPYIAIIVNIFTSIVLCKIMGPVGIFLGTIIAQLSSYSWIDPYLVHRYGFKTTVKKYYKKYIIYFLAFIMISMITYFTTNLIIENGLVSLIMKAIITIIVPNMLLFILFFKTKEFIEIKERIRRLVKK